MLRKALSVRGLPELRSAVRPTLIAVCRMDEREKIAEVMVKAFADNSVKSEAFITTVGKGLEILRI